MYSPKFDIINKVLYINIKSRKSLNCGKIIEIMAMLEIRLFIFVNWI